MSRLTKEEILKFPQTTYGRALGKTIASKVMNELLQYKDLEEQLGCPLEVFVKAFKKYVGWTTDCDFGYDNIPNEYRTYKDDERFKTLSYDSGLIYIAIQEALKEESFKGMSIDDYVNKVIEYYNLKDYTIDYILICEEASIDEAIDYFKFDRLNQEKVYELYSIKRLLEDNEDEIKSKLLKYQRDKYGDVGLGNVRVQGM